MEINDAFFQSFKSPLPDPLLILQHREKKEEKEIVIFAVLAQDKWEMKQNRPTTKQRSLL
jgi:hypothetical protein